MSNTKCSSSSSLTAKLEVVRRQMSLQNTEKSLDQGIVQIIECCNNGGCEYPTEMLAGIRLLSRPLNRAINSDRSKLSGSAIKLVIALLDGLGPSFEPLVALFLPTLLGLCARTNKVFTRPAKECVFAVIKGTKSPSLLPYLAESLNHKSASVRIVAAEGVLTYLNCFNPPDIVKDTRARLLEDVIKLTTRDANTDVRQAGKQIFEAYKAILSGRVESFITPLSPISKKHLSVHCTTTSQPTLQALSCSHETTRRIRPVVPLLAQKLTSSKHSESRTRSLSSELERDIHTVKPIVMSKRASPVCQGALLPTQSRNRRNGVAHAFVPITHRPHWRGDMPVAPSDDKPHAGGRTERVLIQTAPLSKTGSVEMARARKTSPPPFKTTGAKVPVTIKTHSVNSTSESATVRPLSRTGPIMVVKSLSDGMKNSDTRKSLLPLSFTACSTAVPLPSSTAHIPRQFEAVSGAPPVQATGIHVPRDIDATALRCDVNKEDLTITTPKTSSLWPIHREDLFASSHDGYTQDSVSDRLRRIPKLLRRVSNYARDCIGATPSLFIVHAQKSYSTNHPETPVYRSKLFTPRGQLPKPSQPTSKLPPPFKMPPLPSFELPPFQPPSNFPPPFKLSSAFEMPSFQPPSNLPPPFKLPSSTLPPPFELPSSQSPSNFPPSFELPPFKPFEIKLPPSTRQTHVAEASSAPPMSAWLKEMLEKYPLPVFEMLRVEV